MATERKPTSGLLTRWFALTSSNIWEAVLMFGVYISIRWFPPLRSTALFLQVYVLAVIAREAVVDYGRVFVRLCWWLSFARNDGHLRVPWSNLHTAASELAGFFLMALIMPLFPVYMFAMMGFCIHAVRKRRSLGATLYFTLILPALGHKWTRRGRNRNRFVKVFSSLSGTQTDYSSADEDAHGRYSSSGEETELEISNSHSKRARYGRTKRLQLLAIVVFNCVLLRLLVENVYPAKVFLETVAFAILLVCISLTIVFIGGTHVTIVFALSLEVVMVIKGVELETVRHEVIVWGCFLVPLVIHVNTLIFRRIIDDALYTLRRENSIDSRRTKLALLYHAIPVDAGEATHKMWDTLEKRGERPAERNRSNISPGNATFVELELDRDGTIHDFRVALGEKEDEKRWNLESV